ncbi:hypothetical protein HAX54_018499 [Datura stramonium]|uniref:Thioredoxin domain-containing protein n=1 Tax=Datura stramonium TaxID=4076 RepID=A0ABS8UQ99_DATST|nr:hypothetical protein [Datura stramonium]
MPLKVLDATVATFNGVFEKFRAESPKNKANFILFLADIDPSTNLSWCPDCRLRCIDDDVLGDTGVREGRHCVRAEPVIYKKLEASSDDIALLRAYVGDRPTWRTPQHPWRVDRRFNLKGVPTLIRWENDAIRGQLEDHEAHLDHKISSLLNGN